MKIGVHQINFKDVKSFSDFNRELPRSNLYVTPSMFLKFFEDL